MQISFKHKFLFVHIPKTGGTSVRSALEPYQPNVTAALPNVILQKLGINVNLYIGGYQSYRFRKHARLETAKRRLPTSVFESLFKFCIVRNPWDLLVSNYCYLKATTQHKRHQRVCQMDFSEFIEFSIAKRIGFQKLMVSDAGGKLLVDFAGRFENLNEDFRTIISTLRITAGLPHLNGVSRSDYREYYTQRLIMKVKDAYREDIDAFEYEFEPFDSISQRQAA